jgi:pimeloyl-ACP methyl ester carboxylesterase
MGRCATVWCMLGQTDKHALATQSERQPGIRAAGGRAWRAKLGGCSHPGLTSRPLPPADDDAAAEEDNPYKLVSQARLTLRFCWALGLQRVLLVGHSDGALISVIAGDNACPRTAEAHRVPGHHRRCTPWSLGKALCLSVPVGSVARCHLSGASLQISAASSWVQTLAFRSPFEGLECFLADTLLCRCIRWRAAGAERQSDTRQAGRQGLPEKKRRAPQPDGQTGVVPRRMEASSHL